MSNTSIATIITASAISIVLNGVSTTIVKSDPRYEEILIAVKDENNDRINELLNPSFLIQQELAVIDDVTIYRNRISINGVELTGCVINKLIVAVIANEPYTALLNFIKRLQNNSSYRAREGLYKFLEAGSLPLTEDGFVISYKIVTPTYRDVYTGTFDNKPGQIVEMERRDVNDDPNQTCSAGLHVCGPEYLPNYGTSTGRVIVLCKVDPADFVSFPTDYNCSKARVCKYEVLCAIAPDKVADVCAQLASCWRWDIDYQDNGTYPYLFEHLQCEDITNKLIAEIKTDDVRILADIALWQQHNKSDDELLKAELLAEIAAENEAARREALKAELRS